MTSEAAYTLSFPYIFLFLPANTPQTCPKRQQNFNFWRTATRVFPLSPPPAPFPGHGGTNPGGGRNEPSPTVSASPGRVSRRWEAGKQLSDLARGGSFVCRRCFGLASGCNGGDGYTEGLSPRWLPWPSEARTEM